LIAILIINGLLILSSITFLPFLTNVKGKNPDNIGGNYSIKGGTLNHFSNWDVTIEIGMDGSIEVNESITYNVGPGSYSQANRWITWDKFHDINYFTVDSGPNTPHINSVVLEKTTEQIEIYWYYDLVSVGYSTTKDLTFNIIYNVSCAMDLRGNRDRLYWNVVGDDIPVNVLDIDTTVYLPKLYDQSKEDEIQSRTYYLGEDHGDDDGSVGNDGSQTFVTFSQSQTIAYESYTIDISAPPAGINMPFSWRVYLNQNAIISILLGLVPMVLFYGGYFLIIGKDPWVNVVPKLNDTLIKKCQQCGYKDLRTNIEYCPLCGGKVVNVSEVGPPNDLTPAEVGTLLDNKMDKTDFVAEVFYLAEQGYLKIIQTPESNEMYFMKTQLSPRYGHLPRFDKELLTTILDNAIDTICFTSSGEDAREIPIEVTSLSTIKSVGTEIWNKRSEVYKKLSGGETKYFTRNPETVKGGSFMMALGLTFFLSIGLFFLRQVIYVRALGYSIFGVIIAGVLGIALSFKMPKLTKEGAKVKASWENYLQLLRGKSVSFPDPYEQFSFSMDHFSYLLVCPNFKLPKHLQRITEDIRYRKPPRSYRYVSPYWFYYPGIYYPSSRRHPSSRTISGIDSMGRGFESIVDGISNMAESLPNAISGLAEGLSGAISDMSESFVAPSSSGGSSGFGGGSSGGGGGGGGAGIG
jgi:uncharacterized membrane protein YgcG